MIRNSARWRFAELNKHSHPTAVRVLALPAVMLGCLLVCACSRGGDATDSYKVPEAYEDLLDYRYRNCKTNPRGCSLFSDNGAWHAYALPATPSVPGFPGPYLLTKDYGSWLGARLGAVSIIDLEHGGMLDTRAAKARSWSEPGRLRQRFEFPDLLLESTLVFADGRSALLAITLEQRGANPGHYSLELADSPQHENVRMSVIPGEAAVVASVDGAATVVETRWLDDAAELRLNDNADGFSLGQSLRLARGGNHTMYVLQSVYLDASEAQENQPGAKAMLLAADQQLANNRERWRTYEDRLGNYIPAMYDDRKLARLAMKSMVTLIANWRSPAGDLTYDGMYPSMVVDYFNGVWSWDTWKQAVATSYFDPALAAAQIRGMFQYQNERGMVADVIYVDKAENNWRDSKPPLAAWAVWQVFDALQDKSFIEEMYPLLVRYHRWWYSDRDHDQDGLAEYGSTDGTKIAAAWESGMDNAVRFDDAGMLRNSDGAWSLNQESVDLNSYLYAEKLWLADMARHIGRPAEAAQFEAEARQLQQLIRARMFEPESGYFYDTSIDGSRHIRAQGPEGWAPLWTGVASRQQSSAVADVMLDPARFATLMPFPTLAANHPDYQPEDGYWRGPVWLDQAYFATAALESAGRSRAAQEMRERLVYNAKGLLDQSPLFENYVPGTGQGVQAPHFSWTAAHYLMLLADWADAETH